jgi:hypothetical protein
LWRILDGKVESGLMTDSELQGGSPHPVRLRTNRLAPVSKFELCTGIVYGPPTDSPVWGYRVEDVH